MDGVHKLFRADIDGTETVIFTNKKRVRNFISDKDGKILFVKLSRKAEQIVYKVQGKQLIEILKGDYIDDLHLVSYLESSDQLIVKGTLFSNNIRLVKYKISDKTYKFIHQVKGMKEDLSAYVMNKSDSIPRIAEYKNAKVLSYSSDPELNSEIHYIQNQFKESQIQIRISDSDTYLLI